MSLVCQDRQRSTAARPKETPTAAPREDVGTGLEPGQRHRKVFLPKGGMARVSLQSVLGDTLAPLDGEWAAGPFSCDKASIRAFLFPWELRKYLDLAKYGPIDSFPFLLENAASPINQYLWVFPDPLLMRQRFVLICWFGKPSGPERSFPIAHGVLNYMSSYYVCFMEGKTLLAPPPKFRVKKNGKSANVHSQFTQGGPKLGTT